VELARARLRQIRGDRTSVIDRSGGASIAKLERACRALDVASAAQDAARFIGWGEGLTPAGDDYLVGLCAALDALADGDARRRAFLLRLGEKIAAEGARTTAIAAHSLRLAAHGHFNSDILRSVDALQAEIDVRRVQRVLDTVLAVGATSGADTITGIVSGFAAWMIPLAQCPRS
jgi:hypothetical protein